MKNMTLAHITEVCGGIYFGSEEKKTAEVTDIVTDSRKAGEGSLFVAIPGERVDGHKFIPNVASQGALAVISEQKLETPPCPYILVKDSMEAIKAMAEYYMQQLNIPVVGITGSVGKTSTKETIASVLAQKYRVLKTDANFNNELGLSLTVFRLREEDEMAVLEMGIDDFGQMHRLAKIARPETAVITNIGWCHLENLKTRDGILQAKTGWTDIFIYPGYKFKILDALITNFHLPESTLVMLVSALAGRENILAAYNEAIREKYRFFSFGDAMFIADDPQPVKKA